MLREGGALSADRLSFFTADLTQDAGWGEATAGCDYVLHVASPFSSSVPRDENELIIPARDGTLRVLRASREAGVKRVVITSSTAAVAYGHKPQSQPFDESNWTNLDGGAEVQPYVKSKTLAERAAWDFIAREGGGLELSVVNPVGIFGPVLGPDFSGSIGIFKALLDGAMPAVPKIYFGRGRRARRRRSASACDDAARGKRRAVHRGVRRDAVDPRHRKGAAAHMGASARAGSAAAGAGLAGPAGGARVIPLLRRALADARQGQALQRRQGEVTLLGWHAARQRGNHHVHGRKPDQTRPGQELSRRDARRACKAPTIVVNCRQLGLASGGGADGQHSRGCKDDRYRPPQPRAAGLAAADLVPGRRGRRLSDPARARTICCCRRPARWSVTRSAAPAR